MLIPLLLALTAPDAPPMVGGDADAHGCRASAGYVWSPLRGACLRLFEAGVRLNPLHPSADGATLSAFVIKAKAAGGAVELWLPGGDGPLRLTRAGRQWRSEGWVVRQTGGRLEARYLGEVYFVSSGA